MLSAVLVFFFSITACGRQFNETTKPAYKSSGFTIQMEQSMTSRYQSSQYDPLYILTGHKLIFPNRYYVSFSEDRFRLSKQCRPWWNAAWCGISPGSSLFANEPIFEFQVFNVCVSPQEMVHKCRFCNKNFVYYHYTAGGNVKKMVL